MPEIKLGDSSFHYTVEYKKKKKNVTIYIRMEEGVKVTAPQKMTQTEIESMVREKAQWIVQKLKQMNEQKSRIEYKQYVNGELFLYLGEKFPLTVHTNETRKRPTLSFVDDGFHAQIPSTMSEDTRNTTFEELFRKWYINTGREVIEDRVAHYSKFMDLYPSKISVKQQKKRWGTCTSQGHLHFNWKLTMAPMDVIDYVVVHELAHLKHFNHSVQFWNLVESVMPDYRKKKDWLRKNGILLNLT